MAGNLTAMIASIFSGGVTADPYYEYTTLLLPGNGTNGAQNNTFLDGSTNNFTITRNGNTTQGTFSPFSQTGWCSYSPGGSGNYWSVGGGMPSSQGTAFTLECWIYLTDLSTFRTITRGDNSGQLDLTINSAGTISLDNTSVVAICQGPTGAIQANRWHHIMVTRTTGNVYRVYVDGTGGTASSAYNTSMTANPRIGYNGFSQTYNFVGYISNFRVTNTLVQSNNFTPPTSPLTAISGTQLLTFQSNRFVDNSGNSNSITPAGSVTINAFSPFNPTASWSAATYGGSGYFDGSGDYLTATNNAAYDFGTGNFTVETWVYITSYTGGATDVIISNYQNSTNGWTLGIFGTTGKFYFAIAGDSGQIDDTAALPLNQWVHLAAVRSSTTMSLFVNGTRAATTTNSTNNTSTSVLTIGTNVGGGALNFNGYLSNTRVVKGTAVYDPTQTTLTVPTAPLTAITNTSLLLNFTNAAIIDGASKNVFETAGNAQVSTVQSKYGGKSMLFDGNGDYLFSPASANHQLSTGNFTVELWVYFNTLASNQTVAGTASGYQTGGWQLIQLASNTLSFLIERNPQKAVTTQPLAAGQWYHIAATRAGSTLRIFVDGVLHALASSSEDINDNAGNKLIVGHTPELLAGRYFNGYIDDFRITKGVARYTANFTPPIKALPGRSGTPPMPAADEYFNSTTLLLAGNGSNTQQNNTFQDSSNNNFTITRSGNVAQGSFSPFSKAAGASSYQFNGSSAYISYGRQSGLDLGSGDWTFECWTLLTSTSGLANIFGSLLYDNGFGAYAFMVNSTNFITYIRYSSNTLLQIDRPITSQMLNRWVHIAVTRSGANIRVFLNGVQQGATNTTIGASSIDAAYAVEGYTTPYSTGALQSRGSFNGFFPGHISNLRLTKGSALYTANFTPSTTPLTTVVPSGTVALLTCRSPSFVDLSANNYTVSTTGSPSVSSYSPFKLTAAYSTATVGGSAYFDGSGDYLSIADNAAWHFTGDFTVECWAYWTSTASSEANIIAQHRPADSANQSVEIYSDGTTCYFVYNTSFTSGTIKANEWMHLAFSCTSGTASAYINGTRVGTFTMPARINSADPLTIGARTGSGGSGATGYFTGYISGTRVINGTGIYSGTTINVPTTPPTAITNTSLLLNFTNAAIIDSTAKNVLETVGNAQISTTQSKFGGSSLYFDGNGDTLVAPDSINYAFGTGDFTIEFWAYSTDTGSLSSGILDTRSSSGSGTGLFIANDGTSSYRIGYGLSPYNLLIVSGRINNQWQHVAFVRHSSVIMIFIDGILRGSVSNSINFSDQKLRVSGFVDTQASPYGFSGYIDDLRITNGIARYVQNFTPPSAALQLL